MTDKVKNQFAQYKTQLRQAYTLIKAGQKSDAMELIRPILAQQPDYVDAWWLAAFAAPGPRESAFACQKVLTLKPDHWPAQQMLSEQQRRLTLGSITKTEAPDPAQPIALKKVRRPRKGLRVSTVIIVVGILVAVTGGFFLAVNITGYNFGLPIGPFFNQQRDIGVPELGSLPEGNRIPGTMIAGTLVVGSTHLYHFFGHAQATLLAIVSFTSPGMKPGDSVVLLDSGNRVIAAGFNAPGGITSLSVTLPADGSYTIRLTGVAGIAQGPYNLSIGSMAPMKDQ